MTPFTRTSLVISDWLKEIAPVVTALGVSIGVLQLWNTKRQAVTLFEDALAKEYREITGAIPTAALLGEILSAELMQAHLPDFYRYFDLSNNQIFLRQIGRISKKTWVFWVDGIKTNLSRPAFAKSWEDIGRRSNKDFSELRRLIVEDFKSDPKQW
jgi:hypothetical protein